MSVAPTTSEKKPRRRWLQYSLRTLLLLVVPVACAAAWVGVEYRKGQRQWAAIEWVEEMGGRIEYDDEATQNDWRRRIFGGWFPEAVKTISFPYLSRGRFMISTGTQSDLSPYASQVTDIASLADLENLESLDLSYAQVSDLTPLARLENLKTLELSHTEVTDLAPLAKLENLSDLGLYSTPVRDIGPVAGLVNLNALDLRLTQVSDHTPLTGLNNLVLLQLFGTDLTPDQVRVLRQELPDCWITYEYLVPTIALP